MAPDPLHQQAVLRHREDVRPRRLPVPAGDAGEPVGDVRDLDVEGRRIEQVEPRPESIRCHALGGSFGRGALMPR